MPNNSLTLLIDETGFYYRIPICLINDPITYDADYAAEKLRAKATPETKLITLKVRNQSFGDKPLEVENTMSISEFKLKYVEKLIEDKTEIEPLKPEQLRMLAMGKELKDDLFLYSYDINDGLTL
jgi:hypothetical protein